MSMRAINLILKKNAVKKIPLENGIELTIDYPTAEQWSKLQEFLYQAFLIEDEIEKETDKFAKVQLKSKRISLLNDYMRYFLKYTIKDIKGIGEEVKLINNELSDELWNALTFDLNQVRVLYDVISEEIEFNDLDKKK